MRRRGISPKIDGDSNGDGGDGGGGGSANEVSRTSLHTDSGGGGTSLQVLAQCYKAFNNSRIVQELGHTAPQD
jgi:hypothetical protein